jgi:hypothetical protein
MSHNLIKICETLDDQKRYREADSITEYLLDLVKSKSLKHHALESNLPTKLLMLEKAGVDTSKYYNSLLEKDLSNEEISEIEQKFDVNCKHKPKKKDTDFHEYFLWMNKNKNEPIEKSEDSDKYLSNLRESFIDFLTDIVMKDFRKENEQITPQNLIDFYFKNREKYEKDLDSYELMVGQTEGIISDDNFVEDLSDDFDYDDNMIRHGE